VRRKKEEKEEEEKNYQAIRQRFRGRVEVLIVFVQATKNPEKKFFGDLFQSHLGIETRIGEIPWGVNSDLGLD